MSSVDDDCASYGDHITIPLNPFQALSEWFTAGTDF